MRTRFFFILSIFTTVFFGVVSISAAQNPVQDYAGGYIGFTGGMSHYNAEIDFEEYELDGASAEGFNLGVMGGFGSAIAPDKYFGFEGNFGQNFAEYEESAQTYKLEIEPKETYGFNARLGQMIGDWMLYALAGWQWVNIEGKETVDASSVTDDEDFDGPRFGLGAEYQINDQVFVRGEYSYTMYDEIDIKYNETDVVEIDPSESSFTLGFGLRF